MRPRVTTRTALCCTAQHFHLLSRISHIEKMPRIFISLLLFNRAVTVADFYHRGGNGPTTAGGAVLCTYLYIILKRKNK